MTYCSESSGRKQCGESFLGRTGKVSGLSFIFAVYKKQSGANFTLLRIGEDVLSEPEPRGFGFNCVGGGEGNRTPVRKPSRTAFYGCSFIFKFPPNAAIKQAAFIGSFILQATAQSFAVPVHH